MVPIAAAIGIFAKETGQGLVFQIGDPQQTPPPPRSGDKDAKPIPHKPKLQIVK
jgi:stringent starvation protein B